MQAEGELERKFAVPGALTVTDGTRIEGYASVFGVRDRGGDVVMPGAYAASLARMAAAGRRVKLLWQHDAAQPIGVWDEVREDGRGLWVKGRLLPEVARAREAAALVAAGAIDGLSIGYRTVRAEKGAGGRRLSLKFVDLSGLDLSGRMLDDADLSGASLENARLYADLARENHERRLAERENARHGMHHWKRLPPEQREEARALYGKLRALPEAERAALRERWRQMTPEQRRQWAAANPPPSGTDPR